MADCCKSVVSVPLLGSESTGLRVLPAVESPACSHRPFAEYIGPLWQPGFGRGQVYAVGTLYTHPAGSPRRRQCRCNRCFAQNSQSLAESSCRERMFREFRVYVEVLSQTFASYTLITMLLCSVSRSMLHFTSRFAHYCNLFCLSNRHASACMPH